MYVPHGRNKYVPSELRAGGVLWQCGLAGGADTRWPVMGARQASSRAEPSPAFAQLQQQQPMLTHLFSAWVLHPSAGNHELWIRERDRWVHVAGCGAAPRHGCDLVVPLQQRLASVGAARAGCCLAVGGGSCRPTRMLPAAAPVSNVGMRSCHTALRIGLDPPCSELAPTLLS